MLHGLDINAMCAQYRSLFEDLEMFSADGAVIELYLLYGLCTSCILVRYVYAAVNSLRGFFCAVMLSASLLAVFASAHMR